MADPNEPKNVNDHDITYDRLAVQHAPVVVNHPSEKYFITSVDDYINNQTMGFVGDTGIPGRRLKKDVSKDYAVFKETSTCYHTTHIVDENTAAIIYFVFYAFNGPKRVMGLVPVESHLADLETIVVIFDRETKKPTTVYLSSHGDYTKYGIGTGTGNVQMNADGRLVVYASVNSHAFYNEPGTYMRIMGLGNDETGEGRSSYLTTRPLKPDSLPLRIGPGIIGDTGVDGYTTQAGSTPEGIPLILEKTRTKLIPRPARMPVALSSLIYVFFLLLLPALSIIICLFLAKMTISSTIAVVGAVCVLQPYVAKFALTYIFPLVGAPNPVPDSWGGWLLPIRMT